MDKTGIINVREHVSEYIQKRKSWTIKNVLSNYFKASNLFANIYREYSSGKDVSFERIRQLSEILFDIKEELHLVYKRLKDPRKNIFEHTAKYTPNDSEMDFIHNVGLLFHKAMVARELSYMIDYYETDADEDYNELKNSYDDYMKRLANLFEKGAALVPPFLRNFSNDVVVLSYFLEHDRYAESVLGLDLSSIFEHLQENAETISPNIKVAHYLLESGWKDRAKKVLYDGLQKNPGDERIRDLLAQCG
ncbi:hypothetical protein EH223_10955 [candidate division KSB1 bacterium]|nr:hypothetical protein [candidate division KSB1 bacterium]RQW03140.1 MAG: hypothetical protein EH223_10955 [candidate division KSB1 bacterium]